MCVEVKNLQWLLYREKGFKITKVQILFSIKISYFLTGSIDGEEKPESESVSFCLLSGVEAVCPSFESVEKKKIKINTFRNI